MRTSINYSSYTQTIYYAVGRDMQKDKDEEFDRFIKAVAKYEELVPFIESQTEDSIMYRITADASYIQMLVNKIAMISYQGCVYRDEHQKACRYCSYQNYCKVVNGTPIEERPQGKWIFDGCTTCCSECGYKPTLGGDNYCPNCGAKMTKDTKQ